MRFTIIISAGTPTRCNRAGDTLQAFFPLQKSCHIMHPCLGKTLPPEGFLRVTLIKMLLLNGTARRCAGLNYGTHWDEILQFITKRQQKENQRIPELIAAPPCPFRFAWPQLVSIKRSLDLIITFAGFSGWNKPLFEANGKSDWERLSYSRAVKEITWWWAGLERSQFRCSLG